MGVHATTPWSYPNRLAVSPGGELAFGKPRALLDFRSGALIDDEINSPFVVQVLRSLKLLARCIRTIMSAIPPVSMLE